jgi:electron transfer flavoprotein alpha subunit
MGDSYLDLLMAQQEETPMEEAAEMAVAAEGGGGVWVVADVFGGAIAPVTLEALGAARNLADTLGAYVYAVLLGDGVADLAQTLYQAGADSVRVVDDASSAQFALEPYLRVLSDLFAAEQPEVVVFGATRAGGQLAARLAQAFGSGLIECVVAVSLDEATRTVQATMPVYGGEYYEIVACPDARPQLLTIKSGAFPAPFLDSYRTGEPTLLEVEPVRARVRFMGEAEGFEPPDVPLSQSPVIVAAGRQAGDFELVRQLATRLGGRVAGDRGARDAGWIEPGQVIDVRGAEVAPQVYVAVGVRGDTFHDAAIEGAGFVAAIHPDPEAPIFQAADLCLEADPVDVLPALIKALG